MATQMRLSELFQSIDAKDADAFVSHLTANAVFRYGSGEPVQGREAIREYVAGFFGTIKALRHQLIDTWERDDSLVCQGEVTYTRHDDSEVTVPFTDIFKLENDQVSDYLVYIDPTPLMS